jgi:hypothetical protein
LEQIGYPRNIVFGDHHREALDVAQFDEDIRHGHMQGTNGPVIDVTIEDAGTTYRPGLDPFRPSESAQLAITVSAAPWVPVEEIRIIVNGTVKMTSPGAMTGDHFAAQAVKIGPVQFPLLPLLADTKNGVTQARDSWLIVEAGSKLPDAPDTDGDGLPDLPASKSPRRPDDASEAGFDYQAIAPGSLPVAFTNPFLIDVDGGGWEPPGLP